MLPGIQKKSSPIFMLSRGAISARIDPVIPSEINHEITLRISTENRPGFRFFSGMWFLRPLFQLH